MCLRGRVVGNVAYPGQEYVPPSFMDYSPVTFTKDDSALDPQRLRSLDPTVKEYSSKCTSRNPRGNLFSSVLLLCSACSVWNEVCPGAGESFEVTVFPIFLPRCVGVEAIEVAEDADVVSSALTGGREDIGAHEADEGLIRWLENTRAFDSVHRMHMKPQEGHK